MTIGDRIREFGQQFSNYSQLAKLLDMTPGTLFRYSKDERKPGADILLRFYNLGCNINWLLSGEGAMLRKDAPVITNIEEKKEELSIEERMERLEKAVFALTKDKDKKTSSRRALRATAGKENSYV